LIKAANEPVPCCRVLFFPVTTQESNRVIYWIITHVVKPSVDGPSVQEKGFHPESPQDASWGERYFHMPDPDGHELSFAHPLRPPKI